MKNKTIIAAGSVALFLLGSILFAASAWADPVGDGAQFRQEEPAEERLLRRAASAHPGLTGCLRHGHPQQH